MPRLPVHIRRWGPTDFGHGDAHALVLATAGAELLPGVEQGVLRSAPTVITPGCTEVIASWAAHATGSSTIEVSLRAGYGAANALRWTHWWSMGRWSEDPLLRQSVSDQADASGTVNIDTLVLPVPANHLQWQVVLQRGPTGTSPLFQGCILAPTPLPDAAVGCVHPVPPLAVPELSQQVYPGGGPVWCSPTSVAMVLGYWATRTGDVALLPFLDPACVPALVAPGVYDRAYKGTGNWSFNTAYAARLALDAYVARLPSVAVLSDWLAAGIPLIVSIRWQPGELDGAPIGHSAGHLVVVVGFAVDGDVIVNDPAADPRTGGCVRRCYRQDQFQRAWLRSGGTVYLIHPRGWQVDHERVAHYSDTT